MRQIAALILACLLLIFLTGCWDRLELEKQSISLTYGFDLDKDGQLIVYQLNPIFEKSAGKTYEIYRAKATTARQAKEVFDSSSNGMVTTGKLQVLLFSEKMLKRVGPMPYLDVAYRDPKNTGNMRMVAVQGSISSLLNSEFKDKPMLPEYLTNIMDVNKAYNRTVFTPMQEFHRQTFDHGITPAISEIKKGKKDILVTGSALLTNRGLYKMSLNRQESTLLLMLQKNAQLPISLTIRTPSVPFKTENSRENVKGKDFVTINVMRMDRDIVTGYDQNHFAFNVKMKLSVSMGERTFDMNMKKDKKKLAAILSKQLCGDLNGLIKKVQKQQLDPFGFGDYARAFQYRNWKKVKNQWPAEFSKANVKVTMALKILDHGIIN
jgi:Ger(x)C family germination protein